MTKTILLVSLLAQAAIAAETKPLLRREVVPGNVPNRIYTYCRLYADHVEFERDGKITRTPLKFTHEIGWLPAVNGHIDAAKDGRVEHRYGPTDITSVRWRAYDAKDTTEPSIVLGGYGSEEDLNHTFAAQGLVRLIELNCPQVAEEPQG